MDWVVGGEVDEEAAALAAEKLPHVLVLAKITVPCVGPVSLRLLELPVLEPHHSGCEVSAMTRGSAAQNSAGSAASTVAAMIISTSATAMVETSATTGSAPNPATYKAALDR